jgi:uncharacterized protein YbaP (TraB family)
MRKVLFSILLSFPVFLSAQNTILWKVTEKSTSHVSYLLGTEHLLSRDYVDSLPIIAESLMSCEMVITEVNKDSTRTQAFYNKRESSYKLKEVLSEKEMEIINLALSFSLAKDWSKFTPGELFAKVSGYTEGYEMGVKPDQIRIDDFIQILAKNNNKRSFYFESDSAQLEILRKATDVIDWKYFKKNIGKWLEMYKKPAVDITTTRLYKQFYQFELNYAFDGKCSGDILLEKRNDEWMKQLLVFFKEKNCFVAVGLSHLGKQCGLIQQLRRAGYEVEPMIMK